ncbi:hypothetical protein RND81_02G233500 [Saponaria officinalis]|uniref:RING-type domain-containing protein n=1 Tax=Saponaria officinalis TaxID=3572 RepID=A0AAW1MWW0_SAPOF
MGLSNFPSAAEGVLPILVMNTVMSVAILKKLARAFWELVGFSTNFDDNTTTTSNESSTFRRRVTGISTIKFNSSNFALHEEKTTTKDATIIECCVCLSKFEEEEEVSELSCKHFFHKKCLDKWFDNHHSTCPLCRSIH